MLGFLTLFHHKQHPKEMGSFEIEQFLTYLAVEQHVAASTQNQALAALLFLYQQVLHLELDHRIDALRAKQSDRLPTVMSSSEVKRVLVNLPDNYQLPAKLMYGCGLRIMECLRLRVKDVDFEQHQIIVRSGKGNKDRDTLLPDSLLPDLQRQLRQVKVWHQNDLERDYGRVYLSTALERKYPNIEPYCTTQGCMSLLSLVKRLANDVKNSVENTPILARRKAAELLIAAKELASLPSLQRV